MQYLKERIKRLIVLYTFRKKNVFIDKTCKLSIRNIFMEGGNKLNQDVFFTGKIGYGSYIGPRSSINGIIGRYCSIASDVRTIDGTHPASKFVSTHPAFFSICKQAGFTYVEHNCFEENITIDDEGHLVSIGNDVWIGTGAQLLPGIHVGDGAIIAAGAVVTKDVEPYTVVGGVPAKIIRKRFSEQQIEELLKIKWWNQSEEWIKNNVEFFNDIEKFLKNYNGREK